MCRRGGVVGRKWSGVIHNDAAKRSGAACMISILWSTRLAFEVVSFWYILRSYLKQFRIGFYKSGVGFGVKSWVLVIGFWIQIRVSALIFN